jgi:hypothetical protein
MGRYVPPIGVHLPSLKFLGEWKKLLGIRLWVAKK